MASGASENKYAKIKKAKTQKEKDEAAHKKGLIVKAEEEALKNKAKAASDKKEKEDHYKGRGILHEKRKANWERGKKNGGVMLYNNDEEKKKLFKKETGLDW